MFSFKTIFFTIVLFLTVNLKSQGLQLNEVVSKNYNGLQSFENKTEDWIEVYNNSTDTISLQDYFLSDKKTNYQLWNFPSLLLAPDSFLIVFASGENIINPEIHTNFKLSSDGEALFLSSNVLVDSVAIPKMNADYCFGRVNENSNGWAVLDIPSPGLSNLESNFLNFSHQSGFYDSSIYLKVSSLKAGHQIFFTTDGREPSVLDQVWTNKILDDATFQENLFCNVVTTADHEEIETPHENPSVNINKANVLKFASFYNLIKTSKTHTKTIFIEKNHYDLPVISLVLDSLSLFGVSSGIYVSGTNWNESNPKWTGNYMKKGREWEKEVSITYFDDNKDLVFEQNAGIRIHGGLSRTKPQKSLRLYARKEYLNDKFNIPHFQGKEYNKFVLRNLFSSWNGSLISDYLGLKSSENLDIETQHQKPVIVYINGEYWGLHYLSERLDLNYLKELNNFDSSDSINLLAQGEAYVQNGTNETFLNLKQFINDNDLTINSNYLYVDSKLNIENFINYHIVEMFFNNVDWPGNNIKFWNVNNGKWRYLLFDLDGGTDSFGYHEDYNMFDHMLTEDAESWPYRVSGSLIFRKLIKNNEFKNRFVKRYVELMNNELSEIKLVEVLSGVLPDLIKHLPEHIERWNYSSSMIDWETIIRERTINFVRKRHCIVNEQMIEALKIQSTSYVCTESAIQMEFFLFPNPASGTVNIQFNVDNKSVSYFDYIITDVYGRNIQSGSKVFLDVARVTLNDIVPGVYFFSILGENKNLYTQKFIVK